MNPGKTPVFCRCLGPCSCHIVVLHCSVRGKKESRKQEPARPSRESEGTRTKFLECPSNVKIKQGLLAAVVRVATLLVQTKVWVKPSLRLKPDTIGGRAESQKAKGISCNHLLSCFLFHKLRGDQVLRSLCHFP